MLPYHKYVADVARQDVEVVLPRDVQYAGSWQKRGGAGIFANLARKWDRVEAASEQYGYDIAKAFQADPSPAGLIDDIRDLRRYLLLTEAWLMEHCGLPGTDADNVQAAGHRPSCPWLALGPHWRCTCRDTLPLISQPNAEHYMQDKVLEYLTINPNASAPEAFAFMMDVNRYRLHSPWPEGAVRDLVRSEFVKAGKLVRMLYPPGSLGDHPADPAPDRQGRSGDASTSSGLALPGSVIDFDEAKSLSYKELAHTTLSDPNDERRVHINRRAGWPHFVGHVDRRGNSIYNGRRSTDPPRPPRGL